MTAAVLLLFTAALSVVAAFVSVTVVAALALGTRRLGVLAPAARARVLLAAAVAPALAGLTCAAAVLADIEFFGCHAHHCRARHAGAPPSLLVLVLAIAALVRVGGALVQAARNARRSALVCRFLRTAGQQQEPNVLPLEEPQAFVVGLLRPRVYVSRGLVGAHAEADLEVVMAHEHAHVRRRDPLRRLLASVALAFHVPGIAGWLERHIVRAQEMAADADAARAVHDAPRVAEALVRMARLRVRRPALVAWLGDHLEARVQALLDGAPGSDRPGSSTLVAAAAVALALGIAAAEPIHWGAETLFRLLAG
ncbi:MAG: M48 family metalloprotease [Deltaproteobacteria bacterium]|nr:M48 family metalloprotease [Deltaproteobacteria bacterium]